MSQVKMTVAARTDVGRVRTVNEDAYVVVDLARPGELARDARATTAQIGDTRILLALSDGMGGHEAGEVASAIVLAALVAALRQRGDAPPDRALEEAVHTANTAVLVAAKERNNGMGATLTAVLIEHGDAWIAEVGDSRAYLLRGDQLRQVTRDQSLVQMLVDGGAMTAAEAKVSTRKNVILQAMGKADPLKVAIGRLALRRGDRLLLCSDGVSNAIPDGEMAVIVRDGGAQPACARLISLANERGGDDNSTAVIAHFDGKGLTGAPRGESVTSTFAVLQAFDERSPRKPATGQVPVVPAPSSPSSARGPSRVVAIVIGLAILAAAITAVILLR